MEEKKKIDLGITALDDMFFDEKMRAEARLPKIHEIPLSLLDPFPDHPFQVRMDEDMEQLVDSVIKRGIITPIVVRPKGDGRYEIVSGHRRVKACELAGIGTIKAEIKEMTKDEAIIMMVDSNLARSKILPSEKAFSYKMKLDAMNRQGQRTDLTSSPVGTKFRSDEQLAEQVGDSRMQINRYIRLTHLIPEILYKVDEGEIGMRPAVEISYLNKWEQKVLNNAMEFNVCTPSHAQMIRIRQAKESGDLSQDLIEQIMAEEKPNQRDKVLLPYKKTVNLIPEEYRGEKMLDYIMEALEYYGQLQQRHRSRKGDAR